MARIGLVILKALTQSKYVVFCCPFWTCLDTKTTNKWLLLLCNFIIQFYHSFSPIEPFFVAGRRISWKMLNFLIFYFFIGQKFLKRWHKLKAKAKRQPLRLLWSLSPSSFFQRASSPIFLLILSILRSKFESSFVAPIHSLQKQWGEFDDISGKYILCEP